VRTTTKGLKRPERKDPKMGGQWKRKRGGGCVPALDTPVQQHSQSDQGQEKKPPPEHKEHLLIFGMVFGYVLAVLRLNFVYVMAALRYTSSKKTKK
jgi:hypothetical protein